MSFFDCHLLEIMVVILQNTGIAVYSVGSYDKHNAPDGYGQKKRKFVLRVTLKKINHCNDEAVLFVRLNLMTLQELCFFAVKPHLQVIEKVLIILR